MLILIDSVERGRFSRRNLVRTVHGDSGGKFPLHDSLRAHGCFGRLSLLEEHEVERLIAMSPRMISSKLRPAIYTRR